MYEELKIYFPNKIYSRQAGRIAGSRQRRIPGTAGGGEENGPRSGGGGGGGGIFPVPAPSRCHP